MASEDLESLLRQFSCGAGSLPNLKCLGPKTPAATAVPTTALRQRLLFEDGIQESYRDILSRSPYIFAANKRQQALLVEAASFEQPQFKFTSSMPLTSFLPTSIKNVSPPRGDIPLQRTVNRSPKHAAAAPPDMSAAALRNGRCSAPPLLETSSSGAVPVVPVGVEAERRGKQALIQRMEILRNDGDALLLLHQQVERHLERKRERMSPSADARALSPALKNVRAVKLQTLQNRINRLNEQKLARGRAMLRVQDTLLKQRQVFEEKMAAKNRHEQWLEVKRAQQRERAQQQARDSLLQKWSINAALVNVALSVRSLFLLCRQKLPLLRRVKYCARVIMKTYRQYRQWKELKRIEAERSVCTRICWRFLLNWRIKKKIFALLAIKEILNISKSMGVLQRAVRTFKYRVIVGQRCIASFLAVTRARLRVQQLQWATMHLAWAKAVADRQAKLNKTKVPATTSAVYQRLLGHYKSHHIWPSPCMVRRYNNFMKSSSVFALVLDTNAEEVPCCTALMIIGQLRQLQKEARQQFNARRKVAVAANAKIKEQESLLRIRMQARSLLCKVPVEEKIKYEESVLQLQRTYAKPPPFPSTIPKSQLLQIMADYIAKADVAAVAAASVSVKLEVAGD